MKFKEKTRKGKELFLKYWEIIKKFIQLYLKIIVKIGGTWLKPMPFSCSMVVILLVQLCIAQKWLDNPVGKYYGFGILVAVLIAAIGTDWIGNTRIFDFWKIKEITSLDTFLYGIMLTTLINLVCFWFHWSIVSQGVIYLSLLILLITVLLFFIRSYQICNAKNGNEVNNSQDEGTNNSGNGLIDLYDLYEGPVKWQKDDGAIIVDERAVDYDLFDRDNILKQLKNAISRFSENHSYVVGLVGKWGSGKTTLLKKIRESDFKNENTVFIHDINNRDDFDLWLFGSQDEMIRGMYDAFLNSMEVRYNSLRNDKMLESISKVVAGIPKTGNMLSPLISNDSYHDVTVLKDRMSKYIKSTHKHYIMCIEDLDRASDDQVVLFLKLISTVFDFPNVTYVLLYDSSRLEQILAKAKNVNKTYKEKVINQEVKIPIVLNSDTSEQCMINLLMSYGFSKNELNEFNIVLGTIARNLSSIRELKIIINSVFSIFAIKDDIRLDYSQVLAMQYLFYEEPDLYNAIRVNRKHFIVNEEKEFKTIDNNTRKVLKEIFSKYPAYQGLLESLFPKIEIANSTKESSQNLQHHTMQEEIPKKSICMPNYFESYFMLIEGEDILVTNTLNDFVQRINDRNDIRNIWSVFILSNIEDIKRQIIEQFYLFISKKAIPSSRKREMLSEVMLDSFIGRKEWQESDDDLFVKCIGILIGEVTEEDSNRFKQFVLEKYYSKLTFFKNLTNYMNAIETSSGKSDDFQVNKKRIKNLYNDMQEKCYKNLDISELINANKDSTVETIGRLISSKTVYDITKDAFKDSAKAVPKIFVMVFKKYGSQIDEAFEKRKPSDSEEKKLYDDYKSWEFETFLDESMHSN